MGILEFFATIFVVLGTGHLAALVGILGRYAIPRAPLVFHVLLFFPMLGAGVSSLALSWISLFGEDTRTVGALETLAVYFVCDAIMIWILVIYSVYWHLKGRRCQA